MQIKAMVTASYFIAIIGVISLVGSVGLCSQWRMKRFLAYSAISNLGFMLLTLGTYQLDSYLYYIIIYAITTLNLFTILSVKLNTNVVGLYQLNKLS